MKARVNFKEMAKIPNVKFFRVDGFAIATDGEFIALQSKVVSLLGSVSEFREKYPRAARSIGVYLPYLGI